MVCSTSKTVRTPSKLNCTFKSVSKCDSWYFSYKKGISFSKVDMRRKCNICSISLPNPTALVQHMNKNHFNLPGGINIVSGTGETISGSSNSPSRRQNPVSPSVQKLVNNFRKVEPKSKVIDRSKGMVHKGSPQRNTEKKTWNNVHNQ